MLQGQKSLKIILFILLAFFFESCQSLNQEKVNLSPVQRSLKESAKWAKGKKQLKIKGKQFNLDCSGLIFAIYYRSGIDLQNKIMGYSGGGVKRLHTLLRDNSLLYFSKTPQVGDILFWDNTYDANRDHKENDKLTHAGMVVSVSPSGDITYIHHNYRKGVVYEKMNLFDPDNLSLNSPMRHRDAEQGHNAKWLSSHLLKDMGKAYKL